MTGYLLHIDFNIEMEETGLPFSKEAFESINELTEIPLPNGRYINWTEITKTEHLPFVQDALFHILSLSSTILYLFCHNVKPRLHLFGHAHEAHGITSKKGITFSNGSVLNDIGEVVYSPAIFEI